MENNNNKKSIFNKRSLKYGTNSFIMIAAVILIAIVVNTLVGLTDLKLDLTSNKLYTLSDPSKKIVDGLKKDVEIVGLFDDGQITSSSQYKQVTDLLAYYSKSSHIKLSYVDPDKNPAIIKELDPQGVNELAKGDFIVKSGDKMRKLNDSNLFESQFDQSTFQSYITGSTVEQAFTGAIKFVTSDNTPVVYFTEGHGEVAASSGYTKVKDSLEKNNFAVKSLNLLSTAKIPDDAAMLVMISPTQDITADEGKKLDSYIKAGGNAVFLVDPLKGATDLTQLNTVLNNYNVGLNYDIVTENDPNRHLANMPTAVLYDASSNSIVSEKNQLLIANSRSINILKNTKEYITTTSLLSTSDKATGVQIDKSKGPDLKGPLDIGVAVEYKGGAKPAKLLVMGNGYFISDAAQSAYTQLWDTNVKYFLKCMNWTLNIKDDVIVPAKTYTSITLNITDTQTSIMNWLLVIVLPLIILGAGLFVYLRRRHL